MFTLAETNDTFPPCLPKTRLRWHSERAREKLTERFYPSPWLPVGGKHQCAGGCVPLPAHSQRLPFQRGPALFINHLFCPFEFLLLCCEWKEETPHTSALWLVLWPFVALWCTSSTVAVGCRWAAGRLLGFMWGITWQWIFIHTYK